MKDKSKQKIKKIADDELDIDTKVEPEKDEEDEEEEDAEGEEAAPPVAKEDEEAPPVAAEGEDGEEECEGCGDEGMMGEEDADDDIVDVPPDQVTPVAADDEDGDGDEDDEDDEDEGEEEEDAEGEGEEGIPDVSPDEVEPVAAEGEDDEEDEDDEDAEEEEEDADAEDGDGDEDADDEDIEEEEDADDEIPEVTPDEVAPVAAEGEDEDLDDGADSEDAEGEEEEDAEGEDEESEEDEDDEDEEEEDAEGDDDKKEEDMLPAPDAAASLVVEPIYETDVDIKSANLEMALFNIDSKDPHWVVFNNGDPLCKISLSSQENPEEVRENFISEGYQGNLLESIRELATASKPTSPVEVLAQVGAKFFYAAVKKSKLAKSITAEETKRITAKLASANDSYNDQLHQNMTLVVTAHAKNFYKEPDAFKVELVSAMKKAGIEAGVAAGIVEDAFLTGAQEWFKRVIAKAKEYCAFTPESLKEIKAALEDAGQKEVDYDASEELATARTRVASPESRKPSAGVPLTTGYKPATRTASSDHTEFGDRVRSSIATLRNRRRG